MRSQNPGLTDRLPSCSRHPTLIGHEASPYALKIFTGVLAFSIVLVSYVAGQQDCESTINSCVKKDLHTVQSSDPNGPNYMCCRAALITDCLVKRGADKDCSGMTGYEDVPNKIKRSLSDPSEVWRIQQVLSPLAPAAQAAVGRTRSFKSAARAATDFAPGECKDFKFVEGRVSAKCETIVKMIPDPIINRMLK